MLDPQEARAMLTSLPAGRAGFTLIEVLIALVVLGILFMIGLPSLTTWMQNTQVRNSADAMMSGLQLARAEAVRRNRTVQFSLVDTLGAGCLVSAGGASWVVSLSDPTGACETTPSDTTPPGILQKRDRAEGTMNAVVNSSAGSVTFNGLGRMAAGGANTAINISNSTAACQSTGPIRCLRVTVGISGAIRMCDPAVTDTADPRYC
jgi:type IV fimbrial biogenesis protein FimT